ncbi:truncated rev protein [Simian immunodeficiency virus]|uniref:Protein Rev n=1 Tax=Simian immunodeficiency virus TaxID=11723 RepID=Q9JH73_SIV|nr:truncated rev protein [Simian immunodeficiency virus]
MPDQGSEQLAVFLRMIAHLQEPYPGPEGPRQTRRRRRRQWRQRRTQRLYLQQRIFEAIFGSRTAALEDSLQQLQISD